MQNYKILAIFILSLSCNMAAMAFEKKSPKLVTNIDSYKAPEISGITRWFNSKPLKIGDQKGKVVLVDFWTYSCINCIRTLPSLNKLHQLYANKGLVIIGVHSPEFDFEKNDKNLANALHKFDIKYAVAMDNNLVTWHNFENEYWPTHYLIDQNGKVVYMHFGEGQYEVLENNIRTLLNLPKQKVEYEKHLFSKSTTPETYLGSGRAQRNMNDHENELVFPNSMPLHHWALSGKWNVQEQYSESADDAALRIHFLAKKVFLVMSTKDGKPIDVNVKLNGKPLVKYAGEDVNNSQVKVAQSRLYELVNSNKMQDGILDVSTHHKGLRVYTFTFGD